jgi:cysteine-rich repeat protein
MRHSIAQLLGRIALLASAFLLTTPVGTRAGGLSFVEYDEPPAASLPPTGLRNVVSTAVSPDGANLYTASRNQNALGVFTRDPLTGAIAPLEVEVDGVGGVDGLTRVTSVTVTSDGACVYATGEQDGAVAIFTRSLIDGSLAFVGTTPADRPQAMAASADDLHVYVVSTTEEQVPAVYVFSRTGCALSLVETETGDASGLGTRAAVEKIAISADGATVYVGGSVEDGDTRPAVNVLSRNAGTGELTFVEREYEGVNGVAKLSSIGSLAVSPDGASLYVSSRGADALLVFDRDVGTGEITFLEFHRDGGAVDGLKSPRGLSLSPDGAYVYVGADGDESVAVFRRDAAGALRFLEVKKDPHVDPPNDVFGPVEALALSPAGDSLYAGGRGITVFAVDRCGNGAVGTDEQCDDGNVSGGDGCSAACRLELCGPLPAVACRGTDVLGAQLGIRNDPVRADTQDQLQFKWARGQATTLAEFGNPVTTTTYLVCIYDGSGNAQPLLAAAAPADGTCKSNKPCWKGASTSYKYNDALLTPDGLQSMLVKEGLVDFKAKLQVKGRGTNLLAPTLPLVPPVTVQVHNTQTGVCWDAVFTTPSVNDTVRFKATGD